jgi:hypothetical protein
MWAYSNLGRTIVHTVYLTLRGKFQKLRFGIPRTLLVVIPRYETG